MSWEIFIGIAALVSFCIAIISPIVKLNTSIVKLQSSIESLKDVVSKVEFNNEKEHTEIRKRLDSHDDRIDKIEKKVDLHEAMHPELTTK